MTDQHNDEVTARDQLTGRVAKGAAWILGAGLFARLLGFVNTIVVARLLVPEDIGLVAVATVAMQLLQGFSDIGVSQAVVKFQNADRDELDTLFTFSAARGLLIGVILACLAPVMVNVYSEPRMLWVFLGVAAFPVLTGFINPCFYEFERDLRFSKEFISTVVTKFIGVVVSVGVAFYFRTYWAIILGMVVGGGMKLFLSYAMRPYMPRVSMAAFSKVMGFSGWLTGVSFVAALNNKLDIPILARLMGSGSAGVYFLGTQMTELVTSQIALPLTRAIYPGLSSLQSNTDRMRKAYLNGVAALGAFALPAAFGLSFIAEDFTMLVLGEQWLEAIPVIQALAPVIGLQSLFYATQSYAIALGKTRLVFFREFIFLFVRVPLFIWAVVSYGFQGAIYAVMASAILHVCLNIALYARVSGHNFMDPILAAKRSLASVVAMSLYFLFVREQWIVLESAPAYVQAGVNIITDVLIGGLIYCLTHAGLWYSAGRPAGLERTLSETLSAAFGKVTAAYHR